MKPASLPEARLYRQRGDPKDLPLDIGLDGAPEHLRTLAAWYREYAEQTDRRELVERRLPSPKRLEELAAQVEQAG